MPAWHFSGVSHHHRRSPRIDHDFAGAVTPRGSPHRHHPPTSARATPARQRPPHRPRTHPHPPLHPHQRQHRNLYHEHRQKRHRRGALPKLPIALEKLSAHCSAISICTSLTSGWSRLGSNLPGTPTIGWRSAGLVTKRNGCWRAPVWCSKTSWFADSSGENSDSARQSGVRVLGLQIGLGKGLRFKQGGMSLYAIPRQWSIGRFKDKVRALTRRRIAVPLEELIYALNPVIRGWSMYYRRANVRR
jgi:Group II intron, maturase-specific domain